MAFVLLCVPTVRGRNAWTGAVGVALPAHGDRAAVAEAHYGQNDGQNNVVSNFSASLPSRILQATRVKIITQCLTYCFLEYTYYCALSLRPTSLLRCVTPLGGGLYPENSTSDMYDTVDFL